MKKLFAILMLLPVLLAQTPLGEILKLPRLADHFMKHTSQERISFVDFVIEHYGEDHNDADKAEDEQLPFKTLTQQNLSSALVSNLFDPISHRLFLQPVKNTIAAHFVPSKYGSGIFHPPRI